MTDRSIIRAGLLYDGTGSAPREDRAIVLEGGHILCDLPAARAPGVPVLAEAAIVTPGLIDLQVNGGGGVLFNDVPTPATLDTIARAARRGGAAYCLPTFITDHGTRYAEAIDAATAALDERLPGVLGLHLEGPFLSRARPGIHPAEAVRDPGPDDIARLEAAARAMPLLVTLAPERCDAGIVGTLAGAGARVFAGHSEANAAQVAQAEAEGLAGVTHLFNAMSQIAPREPGLVGAALTSERLFAGIIADGVHVHPANLALALRVLGPDRLFLVSDAMAPLGTDLERFELLGKTIHRREGRLTDADGTLAGADLSMAQAVTRMAELTGCGLAQAVRMASRTPARALDRADLGEIAPGKRASLSLFDADFSPQDVVIDGKPVA